jgi:HK97 family phage prohead protease
MKADFSGYASKAGLLCTDGRVINAGAFKDKDQQKIPLVWQHRHNEPQNVLGHAFIEDRPDGVYAYGFFNDTEQGRTARELVQHGDVGALSIFANQLEHQGKNVVHGNLIEVSLVLAGANPGAWIQNVTLQHGDDIEVVDDAATIWTPINFSELRHSDGTLIEVKEPYDEDEEKTEEEEMGNKGETGNDEDLVEIDEVIHSMTDKQQAVLQVLVGEALAHAAGDNGNDTKGATTMADRTIKDVFDGMTDEQKNVVYFLMGSDAPDTVQHSMGGSDVSNVFDQTLGGNGAKTDRKTLSHSQVQTIVQDGVRKGSFRESFLQHAGEYGIDNIELLFPEARTVGDMPEHLARQADWVPKVLGGVKKAPFPRIKSIVSDLTAEEARAKGYIKGKFKKEEVISLLARSTTPATIYKKQKLDRDDILDITDFDVIQYLKWEIRFMLDEEIARAILIGDGRSVGDEDKVKDPAGSTEGAGIRSIANDHEMYAHRVQLASNVADEDIVDEITRARTAYRGSGSPTLYTTDRILTGLLLIKDRNKRRVYETVAALADALRVKDIVAVEVMEQTPDIVGIIVNLVDYTMGTARGGEVNFFEDFDIDFNQNKYLMETRSSGALTKPKSAIVIRRNVGVAVVPTAPNFNGATNTIVIPTKAGVEYTIDGLPVTGNVVITKDTEVVAAAEDDFYIDGNVTDTWNYTYTAPQG